METGSKTTRADDTVRLTANERIAIVAGNGLLPMLLAEAVESAGSTPHLILIDDEASSRLQKFDHRIMKLEELGNLIGHLKATGVHKVVLAGGVTRRPRFLDIKLSMGLMRIAPRLMKWLALGDNSLLSEIIGHIEASGIQVIGAHELVPDTVIFAGPNTTARPSKKDLRNISRAYHAAKLIGSADVGQGAVSVAGRVVALEAAEGTQRMLARIVELRACGRIPVESRGVLVKCAKPNQELRADLPAIGPDTIGQIVQAGLTGIAMEAEKSLILDRDRTISSANAQGLFIYGIRPDEVV